MKQLKELIEGVAVKSMVGEEDQTVTMVSADSRTLEDGALFFAVRGGQVDGHDYILNALAQGARTIVCEQWEQATPDAVSIVIVEDSSVACALMTANFYDHPSKSMKVVGVTGTNGKTTVATLLFQLYRNAGYKCGLLSTVVNRINNELIPATHTTPDAIHLQALLAQMRDAGCEYVFMEASSHAIVQNRVLGVAFTGAIFTNITHDHLDYHKTFENYIKAKKKLFDDLPKEAFALSNLDDNRGVVMLQNTKAQTLFYGLRKGGADYKAKVIENDLDGLEMRIDEQEVHFLLTGLFNAYNLLAVYATAVNLGMEKVEALSGLSLLKGAPGRFEAQRSEKDQVLGIVDYAHTPDALLNVLTTIRHFNSVRELITVVGCGGDRDKAKRPEMAEIACKHSDYFIITSDNPRTEDPEAILNDMEAGLKVSCQRKMSRISDRKEAIKTACRMAKGRGSVILVAGKGHETYQDINGVKHHFDDREVLHEMLQLLER